MKEENTPLEEIDKELCLNCPECSSLIEIKALSEENNTITFKCLEKYGEKTLTIEEYLEKIKNCKSSNNLKTKCEKHGYKKYRAYCLDCKYNLCQKCIDTKEHVNHNKQFIGEIKPENNNIKKIEDKLEEFNEKMKNLKKQEVNK